MEKKNCFKICGAIIGLLSIVLVALIAGVINFFAFKILLMIMGISVYPLHVPIIAAIYMLLGEIIWVFDEPNVIEPMHVL